MYSLKSFLYGTAKIQKFARVGMLAGKCVIFALF